ARITTSEIRTLPKGQYVFLVKYQYALKGREYVSDKFTVEYQGDSDYTKAQRLLQKYPAGSRVTCYVNPKNPSEAVLERSNLWMAFGLLFPLPFIAIGAGGIYLLWAGARRPDSVSAAKPISQPINLADRPGCVALFFSIFLIAGTVAFVALFGRPVW